MYVGPEGEQWHGGQRARKAHLCPGYQAAQAGPAPPPPPLLFGCQEELRSGGETAGCYRFCSGEAPFSKFIIFVGRKKDPTACVMSVCLYCPK